MLYGPCDESSGAGPRGRLAMGRQDGGRAVRRRHRDLGDLMVADREGRKRPIGQSPMSLHAPACGPALAHSDPKRPESRAGEPLPPVSDEAWTAVLGAWRDRNGDPTKQDPLISALDVKGGGERVAVFAAGDACQCHRHRRGGARRRPDACADGLRARRRVVPTPRRGGAHASRRSEVIT